MKKKISFTIERVDNLGQGVSFDTENDKVNLIPKTLPDEMGVAEVLATKGKKVQFAKLLELTTPSPQRTSPKCTHFNQCSACSFLHTSYEMESELKKESYGFLFKNFFDPKKIKYTQAPKRLEYRNRIQLHYDRNKKKIGYMADGQIINVPHCLVALAPIQDKLRELYENDSWLELVVNEPPQGHIELYLKNSKINLSLNQRYAHEGFSQVYQKMNDKLIDSINHYVGSHPLQPEKGFVIDLFGGDGNLSKNLSHPTLVVDYYTTPKETKKTQDHQRFLSLNLYSKNALRDLRDSLGSEDVQWLLLDPPRSGLKNLEEFVEEFNPTQISYLSCNPNTQVRDLRPLLENGWIIESIEFLDLFPSTHHLESFIHLKKASSTQ